MKYLKIDTLVMLILISLLVPTVIIFTLLCFVTVTIYPTFLTWVVTITSVSLTGFLIYQIIKYIIHYYSYLKKIINKENSEKKEE